MRNSQPMSLFLVEREFYLTQKEGLTKERAFSTNAVYSFASRPVQPISTQDAVLLPGLDEGIFRQRITTSPLLPKTNL